MKKAIISMFVLGALVVGFSLSQQVTPQPAQTSRVMTTSQNTQRIGPATDYSGGSKVRSGTPTTPSFPSEPVGSVEVRSTTDISEQVVVGEQIVTDMKTALGLQTTPMTRITGLFGRNREAVWCQVNTGGGIMYGSAAWVCDRRFIFCLSGHWEYGIGLSAPGGANECAGYTEGMTVIPPPPGLSSV